MKIMLAALRETRYSGVKDLATKLKVEYSGAFKDAYYYLLNTGLVERTLSNGYDKLRLTLVGKLLMALFIILKRGCKLIALTSAYIVLRLWLINIHLIWLYILDALIVLYLIGVALFAFVIVHYGEDLISSLIKIYRKIEEEKNAIRKAVLKTILYAPLLYIPYYYLVEKERGKQKLVKETFKEHG
ncbi:MAG: hypothetical protein DRN04_19875 [Thermoprotei archaeon]|nr:MAG: hypothetical protein DRN04_19875 [Thermoprotei archaeon]